MQALTGDITNSFINNQGFLFVLQTLLSSPDRTALLTIFLTVPSRETLLGRRYYCGLTASKERMCTFGIDNSKKGYGRHAYILFAIENGMLCPYIALIHHAGQISSIRWVSLAALPSMAETPQYFSWDNDTAFSSLSIGRFSPLN